jgi:translation initiation factor 2 subunit 3
MYAVPGGLLAVGMKVDPQFTRSDNMVGHIIGHPNAMPQVFIEIDVKTTFLKRIVGTKDDHNNKVDSIKVGEILLINISSTSCGGTVIKAEDVSNNIYLAENGAHPAHETRVCQHRRQDCPKPEDRAQL